ncbi:hypothetical protein HDU67_000640 [Dinochytrium kinnereticum]|nr:hypothetical protein HDU67_000640 [Dinochytrium kinnereticum]
MPLLRALRAMPLEVYPLAAMMAAGLGFGGYIAVKNIAYDQDLRIRFDKKAVDNHWARRLEGEL